MLIGKLAGFSYSRQGRQLVTIETETDFTQVYDELMGKQISVEMKVYKPRRSLDANAYFHVLCDKIAHRTGSSLTDVKRRLVKEYGTVMRQDNIPVCIMIPMAVDADKTFTGIGYPVKYKDGIQGNCNVSFYILFKPTHLMDSKQMSHLIDGTIEEAKQLGIETMTPQQLETLYGYERMNDKNV